MSAAVTGRVSFSRRFLLQSLRDEFHSLEMFFSCEFRFFWFGGAVGVAFCFCGAYPNPSLKGRSLPHPLPKGKGFDAAMRDGRRRGRSLPQPLPKGKGFGAEMTERAKTGKKPTLTPP